MRPTHVHFDSLLESADADAMLRVCERFGTYSTYGADAAPATDADLARILIDESVRFPRPLAA